MTNGVINQTGNSRYLQTVAQALSLYPTYESFMQALISGTFPIDLAGINPSGWDVQGTPLNKDTLLKDTTASAFKLSTSAVPDDVLKILSAAALIQNGGLVTPGGTKLTQLSLVTGTYIGTGNKGESYPNSITFAKPPILWGVIIGDPKRSEQSSTLCFLNVLNWGISGLVYHMSGANVVMSYSGNTVSWYATNIGNQLNDADTTYHYYGLIAT